MDKTKSCTSFTDLFRRDKTSTGHARTSTLRYMSRSSDSWKNDENTDAARETSDQICGHKRNTSVNSQATISSLTEQREFVVNTIAPT